MSDFLALVATPIGAVLHLSAFLSIVAFGGLLWRIFGRLGASRTVVTIVTGLLAALEFIVALGTARRAALGGELNEAHWFILAHTVVVLWLVVEWDRIPAQHPTERTTL